MTLPKLTWLLSLAACSSALAGCAETGAGAGPASGAAGSAQTSGGAQGVAGSMSAPAGYAPGALHRLTKPHYLSSIRELLGAELATPSGLPEDASVEGLTAIGAASLALGRVEIEAYQKSAAALARQIMTDAARRAAFTGCSPQSPSDDACATSFVQGFGRHAFRRTLTMEETASYVGLYHQISTETQDAWLGLELTLSALLQSPHFLYRVELGAPEAGTGRLRLTPEELASRLSFLLLGSTPSLGLLDRAQAGALSSADDIRRETEALLADARAPEALSDFFLEMVGARDLPTLDKSKTEFPNFTPSLASSMNSELRHLFRQAAFERGGSFLDIYESREAYVDAELAQLYGLPPPASGFASLQHPESSPRLGLLTSAGFLARHAFADRTSATERGKSIRQSLLCQSVPPPPNDVIPELPASTPDHPLTARERLAGHAISPACAACHNLMDPIGLGLEHFDAIGRYRDTDRGLAIDSSGNLDGVPFGSAVELARAVRNHPDAARCVVTQLYRHVTGHREGLDEAPALASLTTAFAQNQERFRDFLLALSSSDAFLYVSAPR